MQPELESLPVVESPSGEPAATEPLPSPETEAEDAPKGGFFSRLGRMFGGQKSQPTPLPDEDSDTRVAGADTSTGAVDPAPDTATEPTFKTVTRDDGEQVVILEGPPSQPAAPSQSSGVLGGEGSKIRALLAGEDVQPLEPDVVTAAGAQASTSPVPAAPPAAETLTAAAPPPGAEAATQASVVPDQVQAALASGAAASARPPAETLAALTSPLPAPSVPVEPVTDVDVNADDNVASAIVLVVTPTGTGTGVLLDNAGHVLANWHVVTGYPTVSVSFKTPDEGVPSAERTHRARVVRLNKSADLALLRIDDVPVDVTPVRFADVNQIRAGDVLHAIGHPADGSWSHTLGKISKVKPGSSWYAGRHLLHRGTVIQAKVLDDPGSAGAPLFNNRLELVGISAMRKTKQGVLIGVSVETIERFLEAVPAQAAMPVGG
jgi:S1-C subfamily serine protease